MKRGTGALAGLEPARCCHHLILSHPRYFCILAHSCSYSRLQPHDIMEVLRNTPIHCIAALLMLNKGRYLHYAFARETMPRKRLTQESARKLNPVPANRSVFSM